MRWALRLSPLRPLVESLRPIMRVPVSRLFPLAILLASLAVVAPATDDTTAPSGTMPRTDHLRLVIAASSAWPP